MKQSESSAAKQLDVEVNQQPNNRKIEIHNILFKVANLIFIGLLFLLIVSALFNVLGKEVAGITESITIPEIQYSLKLSLISSVISLAIFELLSGKQQSITYVD